MEDLLKTVQEKMLFGEGIKLLDHNNPEGKDETFDSFLEETK
jgi:hypothetical protein